MIFTDNKLFPVQTDNCVIFIGICDFWDTGDGNTGTWGARRRLAAAQVVTRWPGLAPQMWLLRNSGQMLYSLSQCLIVCLAHFDNSHNEQQSQLKIQGLTTNQSGSCSRKKQPKKQQWRFHIFHIFISNKTLLEDKEYPLVSEGQGRWPGEGWGRQNMTTLWGVSMSKYQLSPQENYFKLYSHMFTSVDTK